MKRDSVLKKLWDKKLPRWSAILIFLTILLAIFAYVVAPDQTTNANNMIVELDARPAGFEKEFLLLPMPSKPVEKGFFSRIFNGENPKFQELPINGFKLKNGKITVRHYMDQDLEDTLSYSLKDLGLSSQSNLQEVRKSRIIHRRFLLGTDRYGRDIFSRLLIGSRVSILVGLVSLLFSMTIGIFLGAFSGWYGGFPDRIIMWLVNVLWSIPALLLVFAITLTIGKGLWEILIAIGLTSWVSAARLIRGQVLQAREMDYVLAAKAIGLSGPRIIFRHILPNITGPIMVIAAANFASAILIEAGLSFLGFGVQPPVPSWGLMIKEHYTFLVAGNPLPALIPGLAIILLVLAFNILGNGLRDVLDVRG